MEVAYSSLTSRSQFLKLLIVTASTECREDAVSKGHEYSREVETVISRLIREEKPLIPQEITKTVCDLHKLGLAQNEHASFWEGAAIAHICDVVRKRITRRAFDVSSEPPPQLELIERERLHSYYVVRRQGRDVGLPLSQLTNLELDAKIAKIRQMGITCQAHADDLELYKTSREPSLTEQLSLA